MRAQTQHLVQYFTQNNWVVSAKSELEPSHHVTWMGKQFDGAEGSVSSDPVYIIGIIMLWLTLATRGYRHKHLHRLLGKLQWALRPGRGAAPFLAGPYAWLHQGPDTSKCTPTLVLRALAEAMAAALVPWTAPRAVPPGPTWFVDAAGTHSGYWSAIWSPYLRPKTVHHPPWVHTQQAAELAELCQPGHRRDSTAIAENPKSWQVWYRPREISFAYESHDCP